MRWKRASTSGRRPHRFEARCNHPAPHHVQSAGTRRHSLVGHIGQPGSVLGHVPPVQANLANYLWPLLMVVLAPVILPGLTLRLVQVLAALFGFAGAAVVILGGAPAICLVPVRPLARCGSGADGCGLARHVREIKPGWRRSQPVVASTVGGSNTWWRFLPASLAWYMAWSAWCSSWCASRSRAWG